MAEYKPPFSTNDRIICIVAEICELIGQISIEHKDILTPKLRRENRIKTIHSSLAIEHNSLSLEQVTDIINGKRILGQPNEITEVKNAYQAYELMLKLNPLSIEDLLTAHRFMMQGLVQENGRFRLKGVGVFEGEQVVHVAPPANYVPELVKNLFDWYQKTDMHPLIKSTVFHYEFEFIHPFSDGNGRMGRMWHTLLLGHWKELFLWLPIEELIRERQQEYYDTLALADKMADCSVFATLMLSVIRDMLMKIQKNDQVSDQVGDQVSDQVKKLLACIGSEVLSSAEIMKRLYLSHKPTFRKNYLNPALSAGLIEMTIPERPTSRNQKYRRKPL